MTSDVQTHPHRGTILNTLPRTVLQVVAEMGTDPDWFARQAGLDPDITESDDGRIPTDKARVIWRVAVDVTADPAFGLAVGQRVQPATIHAVGLAWFASCTLRDALRRLARFHRVINTTLELDLTEHEDRVELVLGNSDPLMDSAPEAYDALCALVVRFSRMVKGERFAPSAIFLRRDDPGVPNAYLTALGVAPEFGTKRNVIVFPVTELDDILPAGDRKLARQLDAIAERQLASIDVSNTSAMVARFIEHLLPTGRPTIDMVARLAKQSTRTLQRALQAERTSFKRLLEQVQRRLALHCVGETGQSLSSIAQLLGFSDQSNFNRAFRRWTGQSPGAYRGGTPPSAPD